MAFLISPKHKGYAQLPTVVFDTVPNGRNTGSEVGVASAIPGEKQIKLRYDDILKLIGEFGRIQRLHYFLLCLIAVIAAFHAFNMVFIGATPHFYCNNSHNFTLKSSQRNPINRTVSRDVWQRGTTHRSQCQQYYANVTNATNLNIDSKLNVTTLPCQNGWTYSQEYFHSTIVTEWDLVCDAASGRALADTLFFAGRLTGAIVFGELSDRYGRKPVLAASLVMMVVVGCAAAYTPYWNLFLLLYFLQGVLQCGIFIITFVLGAEIVGTSKRKITAMVIKYFYSFGQMLLAGIAYALRDWRQLEVAISASAATCLLYLWFIPESGRWLLSRGRIKEARQVLMTTAAWNKVELPPKYLMSLQDDSQSKPASHSVLDLLRTWSVAKVSCIIWFTWFVNALSYISLALNTKQLHGDPYLNFTLNAAVELPSLTLALLMLDRAGRRWCTAGGMIISTVGCVLAAFLPPDSPDWMCAGLTLLAKFGITISFSTIFLVAAEVFPTNVRNIGTGIGAMFGHLGGLCSPFIMSLSGLYPPLPLLLLASSTFINTCCLILLPETLGRPLPQSLKDLELIQSGGIGDDSDEVYMEDDEDGEGHELSSFLDKSPAAKIERTRRLHREGSITNNNNNFNDFLKNYLRPIPSR